MFAEAGVGSMLDCVCEALDPVRLRALYDESTVDCVMLEGT